ncbi:thioredoxin domain-containing 6 [Pyrrhoderma noxium]|uniref:Nucleoside diphosphate kinase n=1 Tax=Pyrrhoderma noxium TaxID=2282107 RepID=A0A286UBH1_9AGAM|nr:thioredoxin domain-containing 6 [Pyrrhoderma noxium]
MSGSSTPTTDEPRMRITRTVAIIKNHALKYRLTIERRIEEAGFEIVKERQMEFADNSDKEFLDELFGIDSDSLFEGPVWVYVLERRRAVEVWKTLMGEPDPVKARESSPNSLRALFGITSAQNAVMGSPNTDTAEEQISCLFQSSPPFPPHDPEDDDLIDGLHNQMGYNSLHHEGEHHNNHNSNNLSASASNDEDEDWQSQETTVLSPSSSQLSSSAHLTSPASSTTTNITRSPFSSLSKKTGGNPTPTLVPFKARPVPKTTLVPDISPRTTRAASLRAGIAFPQSPSRAATTNGNGGVNGGRGGDRPSSGTSTPINGTPERIRRQRTKEEQKQAFMDVPGHKRSTVIHVASTAAPAIAPRMSRAASLRLGLKVESPAPRMRSSRSDGSAAGTGLGARSGLGSGLGAGAGAGEGRTSRPASMIFEGVPGHKRRETIAVASVQAPTVAPRTNKSAELRAKKDGAAPPPSSFMFRGPTAPKTPGGLGLSRPSSSLGSSRPASSLSRSTSSLGVNGNGNGTTPNTQATTGVVKAPSIEPRLNRSAMLRAKAGGTGASPVAAANRRRSMFV